ncbi:MAG: ArnT family glycosyltransferase [Patescibacteria group bacterium]
MILANCKSWKLANKQLILLILVALLVRLYRIDNPVADWHAFRQADTASVTREYVKHGVNLLEPKYHDLSNIQSGEDNLSGYRMVEFPLINGLIASLIRALPFLPLVTTSRLISVLASLGTLVFIYRFAITISHNKQIALLSGWWFALLPYSIYYSRVILPEPFFLFFSMGSLSFFATALTKKNFAIQPSFYLSAIFLSLAFLLKPFVVFLAPVYLVLFFQNQSWKKIFHWSWLVFIVIALLPFWWWRQWILQFPSGIPASDWLFNSNQIRFRPAWFRWLFYERFTKLILGFTGLIFVAEGLLNNHKKINYLLWSWGVGLFAYLAIIATGNVQHDYYQVIFIPFIAILLGFGFSSLWSKAQAEKKNLKLIKQVILIFLVTIMLADSWKNLGGYFNVNHWEYVEAGQVVDRLVPADAKVIAPAFGDTIFLFQTNRTGWPIGFEIDKKIELGATHYVTTSYDDEARELEKKYKTLEKTKQYLLLDLRETK